MSFLKASTLIVSINAGKSEHKRPLELPVNEDY